MRLVGSAGRSKGWWGQLPSGDPVLRTCRAGRWPYERDRRSYRTSWITSASRGGTVTVEFTTELFLPDQKVAPSVGDWSDTETTACCVCRVGLSTQRTLPFGP